jgi:hypothetical protein
MDFSVAFGTPVLPHFPIRLLRLRLGLTSGAHPHKPWRVSLLDRALRMDSAKVYVAVPQIGQAFRGGGVTTDFMLLMLVPDLTLTFPYAHPRWTSLFASIQTNKKPAARLLLRPV